MSRVRLSRSMTSELAQHRRLLRDDVGVEGVAEAIGDLRCARGTSRGGGDDEMPSARQRPEHAPDVLDLLFERGGHRRCRELETDGRGRLERLALGEFEVIDVPRDHVAERLRQRASDGVERVPRGAIPPLRDHQPA